MSDVLHKDKLEEAYELLKGADPRWVASIVKMTRMACGKGKDYGNDEDNLANLTACRSMGIEPWVGTTIRMRDKEKRIDSFLTKGELENESLEDAIWDSAVYGVHRGTLYDEGQKDTPSTPWADKDFTSDGALREALYSHIPSTHPFYAYWQRMVEGSTDVYHKDNLNRWWREWSEEGPDRA